MKGSAARVGGASGRKEVQDHVARAAAGTAPSCKEPESTVCRLCGLLVS